jgi:carboxylesterase
MKRGDLILAALGLILLAGSATWIRKHAPAINDFVIDAGGCRTPASVMEPRQGPSRGDALLLHGLSANRRVMQSLGAWLAASGFQVYLLDLPGHGASTEAYSFSRAESCITSAVLNLERRGSIEARNTVVIGHSMGGAIAVRISDHFPAAATVAISPAPMIPPHRMPANLLVFSAQFDVPALKREAAALALAAEGDRAAPKNFSQENAFAWVTVQYASHSSLIANRDVARRMTVWASAAIPDATRTAPIEPARLLPAAALGAIGLGLLFPLGASLSFRFFRVTKVDRQPTDSPLAPMLWQWPLAALAGVCILNYGVPLGFLHLLMGDYLASLLLCAAVILGALRWKIVREWLRGNSSAIVAAVAVGLATLLAACVWANWQMSETALNGARAWRMAAMVPLLWPYFFLEESALGTPQDRRLHRFGAFIGGRLAIWLAGLLGVWWLQSGEFMIFFLAVPLAGFSVLQRLAADALWTRGCGAAAAATFNAILAAGSLAVFLPLK